MPMHLLVETNFLLELVLGQEQSSYCEKLMRAAEAGILTLHMPAFSLMESVYKLTKLDEERSVLQRQVQEQLGQAERETMQKHELHQLKREFTTVLAERNFQQQERLLATGQRLLNVAQQVPITANVWQVIRELRNSTDLTLPDAVVTASLLQRADEIQARDIVFVTRDKKGFRQEEVKDLFAQKGCAVLLNFEHVCQRFQL